MCNADLLAQHLSKVHEMGDYENDREEIAVKAGTMRMKLRQMILEMAEMQKSNPE